MTWPSVLHTLAAARTRRLDRIWIPHQPLDVLAQQIVAEVAAQDWDEQGLFECLRQAWPYRELSRAAFDPGRANARRRLLDPSRAPCRLPPS